jgi:hypothetical protein
MINMREEKIRKNKEHMARNRKYKKLLEKDLISQLNYNILFKTKSSHPALDTKAVFQVFLTMIISQSSIN